MHILKSLGIVGISAVIFLAFIIFVTIGVWQKSGLMIVIVGGVTAIYFACVIHLMKKRRKELIKLLWFIPISILVLTTYLALGSNRLAGSSKKKVVAPKALPVPVVKKGPASPGIVPPVVSKKRVRRIKKRKRARRVKRMDQDCHCCEALADAAEEALKVKKQMQGK